MTRYLIVQVVDVAAEPLAYYFASEVNGVEEVAIVPEGQRPEITGDTVLASHGWILQGPATAAGSQAGRENLAAATTVLEQVRRIGAHSAKDPQTARRLENELYLAVLGLIAQGTPGAAGLAAAALTTQRYGFERLTGQ
jgi:hypothetical protein